MHSFAQDIRYGFRILAKTPAVTAVAILTLALGIGATTAIFTFVNAALIRALPFPQSDRLVSVSMTKQGEFGEMEASFPNYLDWRTQNHTFEVMAGYSQDGGILFGGDAPQIISEGIVTANFFSTLGVNPELGRVFVPADEEGADNYPVVITHGLWQQRFGGAGDIVGKKIELTNNQDHTIATVVGVLPRSFEFAPLGDPQAFYLVPRKGDTFSRRNLHWMNIVGKLKPSVTIQQALGDIDSISSRLAVLYPLSNAGTGIRIRPLRETVVGQVRPVLLLLLATAGFVLLIATANIANLLLAKAAGRTREVAVRVAVGASRGRIVRQFLTESVLLAAIAAIAGLGAAKLGVVGLIQMVPERVRNSMPFLNHLSLSIPVLAFTAVLALLVGVLFGLAPALRPADAALHLDLAEAGRGAISSHRRIRDVLLVGEVAVAATLLIGASLLLQSLVRISNADPGFNRHNLLVMNYSIPPETKGDVYLRDALREIGALPGVTGAAVTSVPPLLCSGPCNTARFQVENQPAVSTANQPEATNRQVSSTYLQTLQAKLLQGRQFTERDMESDALLVAIVNRTLATKYYGGDPMGKHFTFTCCPGQKPREIVGVVDDIEEGSLGGEALPGVYTPARPSQGWTLIVRTAGDPALQAASVRRVLLSLNPKTVTFRITTMDGIVANSMPMFLRRLPAMLVTVFGSLALLLAAIGIYGVLSYSVAQRTREFGIRMALGAGKRDLLRMVLSAGLRLMLIGTVIGLVAAAALSRLAASMLFGVRPMDPITYAAAAAIVGLIATIAMLIPALRAAQLDPLNALRCE